MLFLACLVLEIKRPVHFCDVTGHKKKMLIKVKLLGLKSPELQVVFSSFLGMYPMDIISIESKLGKIAFCPVTSQNDHSLGRHICKTRHANYFNQRSQFS